jgi:hypothetical protein
LPQRMIGGGTQAPPEMAVEIAPNAVFRTVER